MSGVMATRDYEDCVRSFVRRRQSEVTLSLANRQQRAMLRASFHGAISETLAAGYLDDILLRELVNE